jgi:hypothetical protein
LLGGTPVNSPGDCDLDVPLGDVVPGP